VGLGQRCVAVDVDAGEFELRLRLDDLALGLGELAKRLVERGL
jgi:hypothetical protein